MDEQQFGFAEGDPTKYVRIYIYIIISPLWIPQAVDFPVGNKNNSLSSSTTQNMIPFKWKPSLIPVVIE